MSGEIGIAEKVAFLRRADSYGHHPLDVFCRETHMSFVFIAGDMVYKLKKPVRFPFLDFSTIERRESACRAELMVNHRLASDVYVGVVPITIANGTLAIGGKGGVVDWLVVMRRLAPDDMLDRALANGTLGIHDVDRFGERLADFYRHARRILTGPQVHLAKWRQRLDENRRVLSAARFDFPPGLLLTVNRGQIRFITELGSLLVQRASSRRIIDGHGDLKPEHISLDEPIAIIDRIEFNASFRECDPFDEIAALDIECEQLGFAWVGERLRDRLALHLHDQISSTVYTFYRSYRATLRARLTIAHLLDPDCRTPEKWPRLARRYLALAARDARRIEATITHVGKREHRRVKSSRCN
jgi:aminoglycoside phosphotransferase family enzyme